MPNDIDHPVGALPQDVAMAALTGLLAPRKTLPPWLLYDDEGCRLFYRITDLPEYYLTRAEKAPLADAVAYLAGLLTPGGALVEYGASDETKALGLLSARTPQGTPLFARYVPVDVAAPALEAVVARLRERLPELEVLPLAADFMRPLVLPAVMADAGAVGFFPGSTIGNLEPRDAVGLLTRVRIALRADARFLLGADLRKDPSLLVPAYDDAAGVTAAFNLNLLTRLNREAGADFDLARFRHCAVWNDAASRIEMHLVSLADQDVRVAGHRIHFAAGETIHTENSYKHRREDLVSLAQAAGWQAERDWTDPEGRFGVFLLRS